MKRDWLRIVACAMMLGSLTGLAAGCGGDSKEAAQQGTTVSSEEDAKRYQQQMEQSQGQPGAGQGSAPAAGGR